MSEGQAQSDAQAHQGGSAGSAGGLQVDDDGFVRAPRGLVYRRLTDVGAWPQFWPGTTVRALGDDRFEVRWRVGRGGHARRMLVAAHGWRHDEGFRLTLSPAASSRRGGGLTGEAEFWLEEGWGGTVVHHLASLALPDRRPRATGVAYRAWLRAGFGGLKDELQVEVRGRLGLVP